MSEPRPSYWYHAAADQELDHLQLILLLVRELYEASGRWPSAKELQRALRHPGS